MRKNTPFFLAFLTLSSVLVAGCIDNNADNRLNDQETRNVRLFNSILIFEEGWEVWSSIAIFDKENFYSNTSKIYSGEVLLSGHGNGTDSILLTPEAFKNLADYINESKIHQQIPYWKDDAPLYSMFILTINDVKLMGMNKYEKTKAFQGYTYFPEETIQYYDSMKTYLLSSKFSSECKQLIASLNKNVLLKAKYQKAIR